jgi:nucleotide-binding universal stress UspA family protein
MRLQRIVIGIDFSEASIAAAKWVAHSFAPDAELLLCHVVDIPAPPRPLRRLAPPAPALEIAARKGAEVKLRALRRGVGSERSSIEVRQGEPAEVISEVASEFDADLVVIGKHRDHTGSLNWLGSTAERLVGHAPMPVLVAANPPDGAPTHVLAAVDASKTSGPIEEWSHGLAQHFHARHALLTVVGAPLPANLIAAPRDARTIVPTEAEPSDIPAEGRGAWISRELGAMAVVSEVPEVAFGDAAAEILAAATRHDSGLIVIGRRGAGRARRALFGHVTREVLCGARCPVLVVVEPVID